MHCEMPQIYVNKSYFTSCINLDDFEFLASQTKNSVQDAIQDVNVFALRFFFLNFSFKTLESSNLMKRLEFIDILGVFYKAY